MFDTYEDFVHFITDVVIKAKKVSDEKYLAWREECLAAAAVEMENPEFMREFIRIIDKYSGKCVGSSQK